MNSKIFFWNVRGINDQDKHQPFVKWLMTNKPLFGALLERTRLEPNYVNYMQFDGISPQITDLMVTAGLSSFGKHLQL